ncbi:MAG: TolB family protein, partial [Armatimonadota bacterium]
SPTKSEGNVARHLYHEAGGEHRPAHSGRPFPETAFEDHHPQWSRDETEIYFLSDRARPGYPSWTSRQWGLFAVAPDGSNLRCIIPRISKTPRFSPSGEQMAWTSGGVHVRGVSGDEERVIECPIRNNSFTEVAWLDETTVATIIRPPIGAGSLVALDLSAEDPEPRTIAQGEEFCSLMMDHDSGMLYVGIYPPKWKIVRLDPDAAGAELEVVAEELWEGRGMRLLGDERMLLYDTRSTEMGGSRYLLDLTTGESEEHRMSVTNNDRQREGAPDVREDGLMVFSALQRDFDERVKPSARLIFTANRDGSDVQRVTPWEETVVPMAE